MTVTQLAEKLKKRENVIVVDIRERSERLRFSMGGRFIPLNSLEYHKRDWEMYKNNKTEVVLMCGNQLRSDAAQKKLRKMGIRTNVLQGGIMAWLKAYPDWRLPAEVKANDLLEAITTEKPKSTIKPIKSVGF